MKDFSSRFAAKIAAAEIEQPSKFIQWVHERPEGTYYKGHEDWKAHGGMDAPVRGRVCVLNSTFATNMSKAAHTVEEVTRIAEAHKIHLVLNSIPLDERGTEWKGGFEVAVLHATDRREFFVALMERERS